MRIATFGRNLKGLIPVGDPYLVAGRDISDVLQDLCSFQE